MCDEKNENVSPVKGGGWAFKVCHLNRFYFFRNHVRRYIHTYIVRDCTCGCALEGRWIEGSTNQRRGLHRQILVCPEK